MKCIIPLLTLIGLAACNEPYNQKVNSRDEVERAEANLAEARAEATEGVVDAQVAGAEKVDKAEADVARARAEFQTKLDRLDADITTLEAEAATPEQKDEIVKIRQRQNSIIVRVRDVDNNGISWKEIEPEVDAKVIELDRDVKTARVKVTKER